MNWRASWLVVAHSRSWRQLTDRYWLLRDDTKVRLRPDRWSLSSEPPRIRTLAILIGFLTSSQLFPWVSAAVLDADDLCAIWNALSAGRAVRLSLFKRLLDTRVHWCLSYTALVSISFQSIRSIGSFLLVATLIGGCQIDDQTAFVSNMGWPSLRDGARTGAFVNRILSFWNVASSLWDSVSNLARRQTLRRSLIRAESLEN